MEVEYKRSLKNIKRVLEKRGYEIGEFFYDDEEDMYLTFTTNTGRPGKVVWSFEEKEGKQYVVDVFSELIEEPKHLILVYQNMTGYAMRMYMDFFKSYFKAEMIDIAFLQNFIFDHPLTPDYEVLTAKEKKDVVYAYGGKIEAFPEMKIWDPVALTLNLSEGNMVKEIIYYDHSKMENDYDRPPVVGYRYVTKK